MKALFINFAYGIMMVIVAYGITAICAADWDTNHWGPECRVVGAIIMMLAFVAGFALMNEETKSDVDI